MNMPLSRTKIVATLGPASSSPAVLRQLVKAGMNVVRLNSSHGSHDDHARAITSVRAVAQELATPVTILQDLQGPKIRVGQLAQEELTLTEGAQVSLMPASDYTGQPGAVPVDYPLLSTEIERSAQVLLDDGLLELVVEAVENPFVHCRVVAGGVLKSRKGVVVPQANLSIPSLTDKDRRDVEFGIAHGVDWIALSFVRCANDIRALKSLLAEKGAHIPVLAKIEKPQAVANLDEILAEVNGLMVARGDLGVEMSAEKVPLVQKQIVRACNARGIPVITATQMLESMIREPRPTRAEASDVANAVLDGTDCVMLSGETAVGKYPVRAVEMMTRIIRAVEPTAQWTNHPPAPNDAAHALAQAVHTIDQTLQLNCIAAFTTDGYTARLVSSERTRASIVAITPNRRVGHTLNLLWGVQPAVIEHSARTLEELLHLAETALLQRNFATRGDQVLIVAGLPMGQPGNTNLIKLHTIVGP